MLLFRQLSLSALTELCRALRHYLGAGLTVREAFGHLSRKGFGASRAMAERVSGRLERGDDLEDALEPEKRLFPPIFLSLSGVGEQTGMLPEVFHELENYFRLQSRLRTQFIAQSIWPVLQFFAAIFVIAAMLYVLGILAPAGTQPFDPIGIGTGPVGAGIFLACSLGSVAVVVGGIALARRVFHGGAVDGLLLGIPVIGPCLRALALSRFCLALRLTLETAMPTPTALKLSLKATGNAAFVAGSDVIVAGVKRGGELTAAMARSGLFPQEFLHVIAVGEESGRLTEVLEQQARHYEEESSRRLTILTWVAGALVWLTVAILIIIVIFRIFTSYLNLLDSFSKF